MTAKKTISEWFYQYSDDVYNFLVYYTGKTDVEDLVQDVFIKAGKGLHSYQGRSTPKTWLFSIARNVAIDEGRKKKNKLSQSATPFDESIWNQQSDANPEQLLLRKEEYQGLYAAISKQKKKFRDVLILRGIQDLSVKETAEILGWNETKVRTNYHRAIKALRTEEIGRQSDEQ
ncbi:RNA polymerase sigma factor [Bacillus suaedae]|uniref:Sigma-70 family RNA polymerase sigma factor n=1 Tax=Halalkalibacter suaedae TaxID=2822140 RepID=A0A940WT89_9BACI|nr:sigma-70 family RNA polymerase sigma factor [Bacillus suaedae]MBP3951871.1 sigma-70 family RNA polymerase sigma factor [Bacillus suaedae]